MGHMQDPGFMGSLQDLGSMQPNGHSRAQTPIFAPGKYQCQFLENQKVNVPTSPGWIWPKNMGLGKLGVINSQKRLPSGLKIEEVIMIKIQYFLSYFPTFCLKW